MRDFNQNRYSDNRGGNRFDRRSSGRPSFGGRGGGDREMFDAVCDNCGKDCKVPFKPSGNKPVYCSDCFEKMGGASNDRNSDDRNFRKPSFGDRENRRSDWGPSPREVQPEKSNNADLKQQLDAINLKLNQVLKAIEAKNNTPVEPEVKVTKAKVEKKTVSKAKSKAKKTKKKE